MRGKAKRGGVDGSGGKREGDDQGESVIIARTRRDENRTRTPRR